MLFLLIFFFGQFSPSQHGLIHVKGEETPPMTQQQIPCGPMKRMEPSQPAHSITHNMILQVKSACKALLRTLLQHQGRLVLCQQLMVNVDIPLDNFHLSVTLDPNFCLLTFFKSGNQLLQELATKCSMHHCNMSQMSLCGTPTYDESLPLRPPTSKPCTQNDVG